MIPCVEVDRRRAAPYLSATQLRPASFARARGVLPQGDLSNRLVQAGADSALAGSLAVEMAAVQAVKQGTKTDTCGKASYLFTTCYRVKNGVG